MSIFSQIPIFKPKTNKINLSYQNILTTAFGRETPVLTEECLPGDVFRVKSEMFIRFQPLLAPIFDQCDATMHYFFVPSRLCFENIYKFFVDEEIDAGMPAVIPFTYLDDLILASFYALNGYGIGSTIPVGTYKVDKSLMDYFNLPTQQFTVTVDDFSQISVDAPHLPISLLPFIAYYLIWSKYYRDENLDDNSGFMERLKIYTRYGGELAFIPEGDGDLLIELCRVRYRAYKKDYFTSALPWPQKGDDVLLPIGEQDVNFYTNPAVPNGVSGDVHAEGVNAASTKLKTTYSDTEGFHTSEVIGRTVGVTTTTINDLRTAMRVQQLLENNARGGTRQQEFIKSHWGVYAKDARINDPEYIGGASVPIQISEVLSQVANKSAGSTSTDNALGQLGGHGITAGFASSKKYRVTEHGYLIGILSIRPKASYFQGIPRMFSHLQMYDFFFPELSHLGEQEIKNKELMVETVEGSDAPETDPEGTFGYTPRYAEYKYHGNEIHGDFRDTLKYWHMARIFEATPGLNKEFISVDPSDQGQNRVFTYVNGDYDQILVQLYHHNAMLRKMPYFGIPKF